MHALWQQRLEPEQRDGGIELDAALAERYAAQPIFQIGAHIQVRE